MSRKKANTHAAVPDEEQTDEEQIYGRLLADLDPPVAAGERSAAERIGDILDAREEAKRMQMVRMTALISSGASGAPPVAPNRVTASQERRQELKREYEKAPDSTLRERISQYGPGDQEHQVAAEVLADRARERELRAAHPDGAPIPTGGETFAQLVVRLRRPAADGQGALLPEDAAAKLRGTVVNGERWERWEAGGDLPTDNEMAALAEGFDLPLADVVQARLVQQHEGPEGLS